MPPYPPLSPAEAATQAVGFALAWINRAQDLAQGRPGLSQLAEELAPLEVSLALTYDALHPRLSISFDGDRHVDVDVPF